MVLPQRLVVERCAPEHSGLGTGTQLALAVARALAVASGQADLDAVALARQVGRGQRSALGIHGFAHGGFLVEAGKRPGQGVAPLVVRVAFPETWHVVVALPPWDRGRHGLSEQEAFEQLASERGTAGRTEALCRLVLLEMLPALAEQDLESFGEAVYDFNQRVGEAFAPVQGGPYASPRLGELVAFLREGGVRGVGQSSWGQAVFAIVAGAERAVELAGRIRQRFALEPEHVICTRAANQGAEIDLPHRTG
jgi:beta-RFAP synthase